MTTEARSQETVETKDRAAKAQVFQIPSITLFFCALVPIKSAGRPGLKWRDTIHASRDTN